MAELVGSVTTVVSAAATWVTTFAGTITDTPLLTLGVVGVPLVGLGVGLIKRLISTNA